MISLLVIVLIHDENYQIVNHLLRIVREREEDRCELFAYSCEVCVVRLPQNGVKYVESCCKQRLEFFWLHGGERGCVLGRKVDAITQGRGLSQNHGGLFNSCNEEQ